MRRNHKILLCFGIMILLFCSSCKIYKPDAAHPQKNGEMLLSMERTPCFGNCPVYEIKLYRNGLLVYNGKKFTEKTGCYYTVISKKEINRLSLFILSSGFFKLENKYPLSDKSPSDLPGCTIYFKNKEIEKTIQEHSWQTPASLTEIEKRIDSLLNGKILQFCDK